MEFSERPKLYGVLAILSAIGGLVVLSATGLMRNNAYASLNHYYSILNAQLESPINLQNFGNQLLVEFWPGKK